MSCMPPLYCKYSYICRVYHKCLPFVVVPSLGTHCFVLDKEKTTRVVRLYSKVACTCMLKDVSLHHFRTAVHSFSRRKWMWTPGCRPVWMEESPTSTTNVPSCPLPDSSGSVAVVIDGCFQEKQVRESAHISSSSFASGTTLILGMWLWQSKVVVKHCTFQMMELRAAAQKVLHFFFLFS